jgi:hypothetical protein
MRASDLGNQILSGAFFRVVELGSEQEIDAANAEATGLAPRLPSHLNAGPLGLVSFHSRSRVGISQVPCSRSVDGFH